jgi:hypothetical protein
MKCSAIPAKYTRGHICPGAKAQSQSDSLRGCVRTQQQASCAGDAGRRGRIPGHVQQSRSGCLPCRSDGKPGCLLGGFTLHRSKEIGCTHCVFQGGWRQVTLNRLLVFHYLVEQWPKLIRYVEDWRLSIDNAAASRTIPQILYLTNSIEKQKQVRFAISLQFVS